MSEMAGILGLDTQESVLAKMAKGKKQDTLYQDHGVYLLGAHIRTVSWQAEEYTVICNGELYNTTQLCQELQALGHSVEGASDPELLGHGYAQWKEHLLHKLNGVYAFAIWEHKAKRLFLGRDRIGVKPLFYTQQDDGLLFASEIKTLLAHPRVEAQLDAEGAGELLLLGPGRTPGSGVFRNIRELEPGCWGLWQAGKLTVSRYWQLQDREHTEDFAATAEHVRALVLDAIQGQMKTHEPLGTFLSGGLDSSLISSVVARQWKAEGKRLNTFSVDYEDNDKYFRAGMFQPNSDPEFIRIMQNYLDSEHHWTVLSPEALMQGLEAATIGRDLPGMADVDISLLRFCEDVSSHVKIALSGECADEIFGGYPWYRDPAIRNYDGFPWAQTTKERTEFLAPWITEKIQPESFVYDRYQKTLVESDILPGTNPVDARIKQLVNLNFRWFMQTLIDRNERMSKHSGLTVRVPLCDYRIAEYLYGVPWEMKNFEGREKGLLREAMKDYLPEAVLYRKKSPFPKTHHPRYLTLAEEKLRQLLQDKNEPIFQLVPRQALENLLHQDFPWPWYGQLMRRPQTIVYMLQINFWLKHYSVRIV